MYLWDKWRPKPPLTTIFCSSGFWYGHTGRPLAWFAWHGAPVHLESTIHFCGDLYVHLIYRRSAACRSNVLTYLLEPKPSLYSTRIQWPLEYAYSDVISFSSDVIMIGIVWARVNTVYFLTSTAAENGYRLSEHSLFSSTYLPYPLTSSFYKLHPSFL